MTEAETKKLRMVIGMDGCDYAKALAGGNISIAVSLLDLLFTAHRIPSLNHRAHILFVTLDRMQVYDDDIECLINTVCGKNYCNVAVLLWAVHIGLDYGVREEFCNIETIKEQIKKARANEAVYYPFDEARILLKDCLFADIPLQAPKGPFDL